MTYHISVRYIQSTWVRPRQSKLTKALPRFKSGIRIPTRVVLEKYVAVLGKHIELRINDEE